MRFINFANGTLIYFSTFILLLLALVTSNSKHVSVKCSSLVHPQRRNLFTKCYSTAAETINFIPDCSAVEKH